MSNAEWRGVPLRSLLEAARPAPTAVEILARGVDGYTDTFSIEKALDASTLVAYGMNSDPLPERHGYPARLIVPGLYGEKSVKWLTRIEIIDHDGRGFYEQQGWGPSFVVKTQSRFVAPDPSQPVRLGSIVGASRHSLRRRPRYLGGERKHGWRRHLDAGRHYLRRHTPHLGAVAARVASDPTG